MLSYSDNLLKVQDGAREALLPFLGALSAQATEDEMNRAVAGMFRRWESFGDVLLVADGMMITGAKLTLDRGRASVAWETGFWPSERYLCPHGEYAALGFFNRYDLYLGHQGPMPPTLIARFGDGPSDYESANPTYLGADGMKAQSESLREAWRRASMINLLTQ